MSLFPVPLALTALFYRRTASVTGKRDTGSGLVGSDRVAEYAFSLPLYVESHTVVVGSIILSRTVSRIRKPKQLKAWWCKSRRMRLEARSLNVQASMPNHNIVRVMEVTCNAQHQMDLIVSIGSWRYTLGSSMLPWAAVQAGVICESCLSVELYPFDEATLHRYSVVSSQMQERRRFMGP